MKLLSIYVLIVHARNLSNYPAMRFYNFQSAFIQIINEGGLNMSKKLSVIIPLYNVEDYIVRAAKSIASQAFEGLEVVVVDDGSTDKSLEVCAKYLQGVDARFISQDNTGPGGARNTGIFEASGEYIMFVDADDFLLPDAFKNILTKLENSKPDVLFGRYLKWMDDIGLLKASDYDYSPTSDRTAYILNDLPESSWNIWRFISKRSFIIERELLFESRTLFEDVPWILQMLDSADSIDFLQKPFYAHHLRRQNSIMNSMSPERMKDLNTSISKLLHHYKDRPGICDALIWQSFLYINEYYVFPKEVKGQIYESYISILPQYSLSSSVLCRLAAKCTGRVSFSLLSFVLFQTKRIRRVYKYGEKSPNILSGAKESRRTLQEA